jgi:hypothetical protein
MKLYTNYVIGYLVMLGFCNSLYPKELAVFFSSYFVDHHPILKSRRVSKIESKRRCPENPEFVLIIRH